MSTPALTTERIIGVGYLTLAGARRCIRSASRSYYAGVTLDVRTRPHADLDRPEYVVVAL